MGLLPIDSKFPLENFNRIQEGIDARREFIADVKTYNRYIWKICEITRVESSGYVYTEWGSIHIYFSKLPWINWIFI